MTVEGCYHLAVDKSIKVTFAFRRDFTEPGPYTIELYRGRAVNDDKWEKIAQVTDQSWIFDKRPKPRPHEYSTYYRLRVTDGEGVTYWCHPPSMWSGTTTTGAWSKRSSARSSSRAAATARLGPGCRYCGWLLKKRQFGDPCETYLDPTLASRPIPTARSASAPASSVGSMRPRILGHPAARPPPDQAQRRRRHANHRDRNGAVPGPPQPRGRGHLG